MFELAAERDAVWFGGLVGDALNGGWLDGDWGIGISLRCVG